MSTIKLIGYKVFFICQGGLKYCSFMRHDLIPIGRIYREHGVHGACKVFSYDPDGTFLTVNQRYELIGVKGSMSQVRLMDLKKLGRYYLAVFDGFSSPEVLQQWRKAEICLSADQMPVSQNDELFDHEWIGFVMTNQANVDVGRVLRIERTPLKSFCIQDAKKTEILIPFVKDWIISLDRKNKIVCVDLPEGLLG